MRFGGFQIHFSLGRGLQIPTNGQILRLSISKHEKEQQANGYRTQTHKDYKPAGCFIPIGYK